MHETAKLSRRSVLMAAPMLMAVRAGHAQGGDQGGDPSWPPVFGTGRSQFTVVRPRSLVPPLRLQDLHGKDATLAPKPGRITLINFWATWCAACRIDLPAIASLARSRPDRLDVYAICTDTKDVRKIGTFLGGLKVQGLTCYADPYGAVADPNNTSIALFELVGMPITYLIGTSGQIEGYITGAADWQSPEGAALLQFYRAQG